VLRSALRRLRGAAAFAASVACLLPAPAAAELLVFEGELSMGGLGGPATVDTAIGVATVNGSGTGLHLDTLQIPGGLFSAMSTSTPTGGSFTKIIITIGAGAGTFTGGASGPLQGTLPVPGNVRVCLLLDCALAVDVPFTENGTRGVGLGGAPIVRTLFGTGTLSLFGNGWQDASATITTSAGAVVTPGFAHGPLSFTSSTAQAGGVVRLTSPAPLAFSSGVDPPLVLATFATLDVRFLPEPGSFVALCAGALAIAALGARRRRRA
jgi:hypothetical protein